MRNIGGPSVQETTFQMLKCTSTFRHWRLWMQLSNFRAAFTAAFLPLIMTPASAKDFTVTVTARNRDYRDTPVHALITAPPDYAGVALMLKDVPVPVQSRKSGSKVEVVWIVKELKKGDSLRYRLTFD